MPEHATSKRSGDMSDFDPFGLDLRTNPSTVIPGLLARSPGFMMAEGTPSAYVARHEHVTQVARDFKRFSSVKPTGLAGMERFDMFNGNPVMNYSDPPAHTRRRKVVNASFTPMRVKRLEADAQATIDQLLDAAIGRLEIDGVRDLCQPLTTQVLLGGVMNVAPEDRRLFFATMQGMALLDTVRPGQPKPQPYLDAWAAGAAYCRRMIEQARIEQADSLIGVIAKASDEGGSIDDDEMMAMMMVLLTGGLTTMASAAATAIRNIALSPALKARIAAEPSLAAFALEEAMRLHPPVTLSMRFATEDVKIGDEIIPSGMPVYMLWAAANHDPAVFPDPDRFDPDRPNLKDQVAFGYGIHTCIGNAITRSVVPMLIRSLVRRFPGFTLTDPTRPPAFHTGSARGRHLTELPLRLAA